MFLRDWFVIRSVLETGTVWEFETGIRAPYSFPISHLKLKWVFVGDQTRFRV